MRRTEWEAWLAFTNPNAAAGSIRTLLGEPGRCFCQDLLLLPKDPTLPTQPAQLIELGGGKPLSVSVVNIGLVHPIADGLLRRFELPAQLTRRATRPHQAHHLRPELRRVRRSRSRHSLNTPLREQSQVIECPPKRVNLNNTRHHHPPQPTNHPPNTNHLAHRHPHRNHPPTNPDPLTLMNRPGKPGSVHEPNPQHTPRTPTRPRPEHQPHPLRAHPNTPQHLNRTGFPGECFT